MTTTYEETTTHTSSSDDGIGLDRIYLKHWRGFLKIAEAVADIIAFICASVWIHWGAYGGGWVQFVTMSAFITTLLLYCFHLFRIIYKLPGPWGIIELIYCAAYSVMMLIAAIVCAARGHWHSSIAATAVFTFVATALYILETFFVFRDWREGGGSAGTHSSSTTTTTTTTQHTTYESKVQY